MISAQQVRAARALLGWSQQTLADRAIVSVNAINRLERGAANTKASTLSAVERALRKAGVEFLAPTTTHGEGVCFSSPPE